MELAPDEAVGGQYICTCTVHSLNNIRQTRLGVPGSVVSFRVRERVNSVRIEA